MGGRGLDRVIERSTTSPCRDRRQQIVQVAKRPATMTPQTNPARFPASSRQGFMKSAGAVWSAP